MMSFLLEKPPMRSYETMHATTWIYWEAWGQNITFKQESCRGSSSKPIFQSCSIGNLGGEAETFDGASPRQGPRLSGCKHHWMAWLLISPIATSPDSNHLFCKLLLYSNRTLRGGRKKPGGIHHVDWRQKTRRVAHQLLKRPGLYDPRTCLYMTERGRVSVYWQQRTQVRIALSLYVAIEPPGGPSGYRLPYGRCTRPLTGATFLTNA